MTAVTWWGHSFVTVELPGATVATDPLMSRRLLHLRRASPPPPPHATRADVVLISHLHHAAAPARQLVLQDRVLATEHAWLFPRAVETPARPERPTVRPALPEGTPVEQLTEEEMEVLAHLAALLTTEEIAAEMYISVNTVRTHVRNILRKLGVLRRNAAVRVAREHQLLDT